MAIDQINHPAHYTTGNIECIDAIASALSNDDAFLAYCKGNVMKYIWRYENKGGVQDLKKADWYLNKMIDLLDVSSFDSTIENKVKPQDVVSDLGSYENQTLSKSLFDFQRQHESDVLLINELEELCSFLVEQINSGN